MWIVEAYSQKTNRILDRDFIYKGNNVYTYQGDKRQCRSMQKKLARRGIESRIFESGYARSGNYRRIFLEAHPDEMQFRCVYCGNMIPRYQITVDHAIPVYAAKKYHSARLALKMKGCDGVNDPNNLVPSCRRCNERKGSDYNLVYALRAQFGSDRRYWIIAHSIRITLVMLVLFLLLYLNYRTGLFKGD